MHSSNANSQYSLGCTPNTVLGIPTSYPQLPIPQGQGAVLKRALHFLSLPAKACSPQAFWESWDSAAYLLTTAKSDKSAGPLEKELPEPGHWSSSCRSMRGGDPQAQWLPLSSGRTSQRGRAGKGSERRRPGAKVA